MGDYEIEHIMRTGYPSWYGRGQSDDDYYEYEEEDLAERYEDG